MATEEEKRNPLEVRDLMTRVASGVDPEETTPWEQVAPRQIDGADYVIPGNDDAIRSCSLVARVIADAIGDGFRRWRTLAALYLYRSGRRGA